METKFCPKCKRDLPLDMYYSDKSTKTGLSCYCRECKLEYAKSRVPATREQRRAYKKKYWQENKHRLADERKQYRDAHKEDMKIYHKKHYQEHKKEIRAYMSKYKKEKMKNDSVYRYKEKIGHFVRCGFYRKGFQKPDTTENIVGCTAEELRAYLNETFYKNYGYEYDGTDKVHIDHIIPLATAKTQEDVTKLFHYTNLQLLKAEHNQMKSDRLDFELPPLP